MPDLLCVNNKTSPFILSRREGLTNKRRKTIKIKNFENLGPGHLLRCSYISNCDAGIYVLPLIFDFTDDILIKTEVNTNVIMCTILKLVSYLFLGYCK